MESFAGCPQAAAFLVKQFAIGFSLCRQMLAVLHYLIEKSLSTEIYTRGSDFHILFCVTLKAQWSERYKRHLTNFLKMCLVVGNYIEIIFSKKGEAENKISISAQCESLQSSIHFYGFGIDRIISIFMRIC